jgi:ribosome biogenesis GTPase A
MATEPLQALGFRLNSQPLTKPKPFRQTLKPLLNLNLNPKHTVGIYGIPNLGKETTSGLTRHVH